VRICITCHLPVAPVNECICDDEDGALEFGDDGNGGDEAA